MRQAAGSAASQVQVLSLTRQDLTNPTPMRCKTIQVNHTGEPDIINRRTGHYLSRYRKPFRCSAYYPPAKGQRGGACQFRYTLLLSLVWCFGFSGDLENIFRATLAAWHSRTIFRFRSATPHSPRRFAEVPPVGNGNEVWKLYGDPLVNPDQKRLNSAD